MKTGVRRTLLALAVCSSAAAAAQPVPSARAAADPLSRPVALPALRAPLEMVLRETARRAGVGLAYSASRLPLAATVAVAAQPRQSLAATLAVVLRGQPVAWGVLDGQVVLWRQADPAPAGVVVAGVGAGPDRGSAAGAATARLPARPGAPTATPTGTPTTATTTARAATTAAARPRPMPATAASPEATAQVRGAMAGARSGRPPVPSGAAQARGRLTTGGAAGPGDGAVGGGAAGGLEVARAATTTGAAAAFGGLAGGAASSADLAPLTLRAVAVIQPVAAADSGAPVVRLRPVARLAPVAWRRRVAQVSLMPPLSTNWGTNGQTVNRFSLNLLAGRAAGVRGVEVGGLLNSVADSVAGLQAAGVLNHAGGVVVGAQVAGVGNTAHGGLEGVQSAGLWNVAHGPAQGWQSAGLFNVAHTERGTTPEAVAAVGEPLVQLGGLFNTAPRGLRGAQIAGLFNSAGVVRGAQIAGLLNIADSVTGVSLAPLNFVRHGYHAFELTTDGTWPLLLSLKLGGSAAFYTTFIGAWDPTRKYRWGLGYGVGGEIGSRQRLSLSLDAFGLQLNQDDSSFDTWGRALNMHTQFRALAGWATGPKKRLRLVAGPVFNLLITQRPESLTEPDESILPTTGIFFLNSYDAQGRTRVNGWLSALVGVRWKW